MYIHRLQVTTHGAFQLLQPKPKRHRFANTTSTPSHYSSVSCRGQTIGPSRQGHWIFSMFNGATFSNSAQSMPVLQRIKPFFGSLFYTAVKEMAGIYTHLRSWRETTYSTQPGNQHWLSLPGPPASAATEPAGLPVLPNLCTQPFLALNYKLPLKTIC